MPGIAPVVGRDTELMAVSRFTDEFAAGPVTLLIEGEPGIGKTTIWSHAVRLAAERGYAVLTSRPTQSEARLSFAALGDLVDGVATRLLPALPAPQRRALEIALLRADSAGHPPDRRAVSLAFLHMLRLLAHDGPVLVAIDDAQWLDGPSLAAVEFALRRLAGEPFAAAGEPVGVAVAVRVPVVGEPPASAARLLHGAAARRLPLGPLTLGAVAHIIQAESGTRWSRPTLRRLHAASRGNPLFALELARALQRRGGGTGPVEPAPGEALPVPADLRALVHGRVASLPRGDREVLALAAAASQPTAELLERAAGGGGARASLDRAAAAGVIELSASGVRFVHPLLASAAYADASATGRRLAHRRLADVVTDPEERARHLALACDGPDPDVAAALDEAAQRARARGAAIAAAELAGLAASLTPPQDTCRWTRLVDAARYSFEGGDAAHARRRLETAIGEMPRGVCRAQALMDLGQIISYGSGNEAAIGALNQALAEASGDEILRAEIHIQAAWLHGFDLAAGLAHADAAVALLDAGGDAARPGEAGQPALLAAALGVKMLMTFLLGQGLREDLAQRAAALEGRARSRRVAMGASLPWGALLKNADRLDEARVTLQAVLAAVDAEGDESSRFEVLVELGHLEALAGDLAAADRYASDALAFVELTGESELRVAALAIKARVDALRGHTEAARAAVTEGLRLATEGHDTWLTLMNLPVLGFLELSVGDAPAAVVSLARADEIAERIGLREPGRFRFHADYAEALVAVGELGLAAEVTDRLAARGRATGRPWALATAGRCRGLVRAAHGDLVGALTELDAAIVLHERLPMPFELARTRHVAGQVARRVKRKLVARQQLEAAAAVFEQLGTPLWAARARADLARAGSRAPAPAELSATERRIAELVAGGYTNREVADTMFVSLRTVEANLSRVYRKVGVRSRTELARALPGAAKTTTPGAGDAAGTGAR